MFCPCVSGSDYTYWKDGYILLVPSVCVGNVGQLAADLILHTLSFKKVGYLETDCVLPVIGNGNDPVNTSMGGTCELLTSTDVYENREHKLVLVQLRAPCVKGKQKQFVKALNDWINQSHFDHVVMLTASYAHEGRDSQISGTQLRYLLTTKAKSSLAGQFKDNLRWTELERRPVLTDSTNTDGIIYIPGSGLAKQLYHTCEENRVSAIVLLKFCSEGDNIIDSYELANYLNEWLKLVAFKADTQHVQWTIPSSWKLQYGNRFDTVLFN